MKTITALLVLAGTASAHYNFPSIINGGVTTTPWEYVRQWTGYYTYDPVTTVLTNDIRCNVNGSTAFAPGILPVSAGSQIGFDVDPDIYHPGPLLAYLGIVPKGSTAGSWDGSGTAWFKIYQDEPTGFGTQALVWPSEGGTTVAFTIPPETPSGDYLVRVEHIGLHVATSVGGAQFYLSCGQITVTNGGSGTPGPLVAFPGAYSPTDPAILIDIYYPVPTSYTPPGPPVWPAKGSSAGTSSSSRSSSSTAGLTSSSRSSSTTAKSTSTSHSSSTTVGTTSSSHSSSTPAGPTTSSGLSSGCSVAKYDQCGGTGYTGCSTCQSGSSCSAVSPPYYSQCL